MASMRICGTDSSVALMVSRYIYYFTKVSKNILSQNFHHVFFIHQQKKEEREENLPRY
jgi:hypothetical protein